ncbi:MAG TPA: NUDIX hydrolase [Candidatus Limnocylindrales bacterium]|nr:NUDIX hydrolase [Candidatus Limnocylindrales bacterium]
MSNSSPHRRLNWAQRLQAIAQSGLHYNPPVFERERYEQVLEIATEMAAADSTMAPDEVRMTYAAETGHATPKVDVRGVVFKDERMLLVQEMLDGGRWTLPGGWADVGSSPAENTVREVYEESGYRVRATRLLACHDRQRHPHPPHLFHIYKLFFLCELESDARMPDPHNYETGEADWFAEDALPELSQGRVTPAQIARFFTHLRQPELPTDFD